MLLHTLGWLGGLTIKNSSRSVEFLRFSVSV